MGIKAFAFFAVLAAALLVGSQSFFIVDQAEKAIVLQLGQPKGETRDPGLHFKTPFIQDVRYFDKRVLSIDPPVGEVVISSSLVERQLENPISDGDSTDGDGTDGAPLEAGPKIGNVSGEPIMVDTFARYKITDPLQFMKTLRDIKSANSRLESILNGSTRAVLGETTLSQILSEERTDIMARIRKRVNGKITEDQLGIEIVDVRIVRADLTEDLRVSTVTQMKSALNERATERRAKGTERALEITSTANKEYSIIIAEARRDAQKIKGEGDKEAIEIYASAFNVDKDFYSFIRSMEAYENTMANPRTRFILSPDGDFFKHFKDQKSQ